MTSGMVTAFTRQMSSTPVNLSLLYKIQILYNYMYKPALSCSVVPEDYAVQIHIPRCCRQRQNFMSVWLSFNIYFHLSQLV